MWLNYKKIILLNRWLEVTQVDGQEVRRRFGRQADRPIGG